MKSIWEIEYEFRKTAKPKIGSEAKSDWSGADTAYTNRKNEIFGFHNCVVPGSRAPDNFFQGAALAWYNQGYDVSEAMPLLDEAKKASNKDDWGEVERLTALFLHKLNNAKKNPEHIYHKFKTPVTFNEIEKLCRMEKEKGEIPSDYKERMHAGWVAQIAGGAYGTALEGYFGCALRDTFGEKLDSYVRDVDTFNDDITFEIAFLDAMDKRKDKTKIITSFEIAEGWLKHIPYAWSAEYYALENLRRGVFPPESGNLHNYFGEWIGAQMRTMAAGLVAPANPALAARLAYEDSIISHTKNGVYAGIHSAVLSSLAFCFHDTVKILEESRKYIPDETMFAHFFDITMETCRYSKDHIEAWEKVEPKIRIFHWIHAIPNMVAVVMSLYYCHNELGKCFRILGDLGLDVDCNGGEAGTVLGILNGKVDEKWEKPLLNTLETYLPSYRKMLITDVTEMTFRNVYR